MGLFGMLTSWLVVMELRPAYSKMDFVYKIMFLIVHLSDRFWKWYNVPVVFGLLYLELRRTVNQKYNFIAVGSVKGSKFNPRLFPYRTADGEYDDVTNSETGEAGSFFGRNMEPESQEEQLLDPHPSIIATKLLNRKKLVDDGSQFNMLAASWINFMIHDWIDHLEDLSQELEITAPSSVASQCPLKSFKAYPHTKIPAGRGTYGYVNSRTPWWDASVIYGSTAAAQERVRNFKDGKLKVGANELLDKDLDGNPISGDIRNNWLGITALQSLFIAEHNAVCDAIKVYTHPIDVIMSSLMKTIKPSIGTYEKMEENPGYKDEQLFRHARLVVSAVLAKIHTIDWTTQLLKNEIMYAAMRANWYGLLGKRIKDTFGKTSVTLLSGIVGARKTVDHGVPYSLTEEFTAVYRMHPLLPDSISIRNIKAVPTQMYTPSIVTEIPMVELIGAKGEEKAQKLGLKTILTSLGHQSAGSLSLFNYPTWMRSLIPENPDGSSRTEPVDMPALETYRDREHSIPRYNHFRRNMLMTPIKTWEDLTDDKASIAAIRELYGNNVERLDLLVGLLAEKKIKGFAISETAFFIFILMATRRLEADRFFTADFNEEKYTKLGFKWVNTTEGLKDVLRRHHPELVGDWISADSAFSVWNEAPAPYNPIPLYLRWGT